MTSPTRSPRLPTARAAASHGVLTVADLREHGMSPGAVEHSVRRGELLRIARGLYVVAGSPDTVERRAVLATRALRGALADESSTAWWGLPGFEVEPLHVVRCRRGTTAPPDVAVLHRPVRLRAEHLTEWRGVAVTRPARTLFDLAASVDPKRVERAYDTMWSRGLVTQRAMHTMLDQLSGRGRPGIQLMRRLIADRDGIEQPTGSRLERRFEVLNRRAMIPMLRRQIEVGDDENWIGRMDFVGEQRRLVVEIDSALHHAALLDTRRDAQMTERLERAGWLVRRWTEDDIWLDGPRVVRELRQAWAEAPPR